MRCLLVNSGALARKPGADRWWGWPGSSWWLAWPPGARAWVGQQPGGEGSCTADRCTLQRGRGHLVITTGTQLRTGSKTIPPGTTPAPKCCPRTGGLGTTQKAQLWSRTSSGPRCPGSGGFQGKRVHGPPSGCPCQQDKEGAVPVSLQAALPDRHPLGTVFSFTGEGDCPDHPVSPGALL